MARPMRIAALMLAAAVAAVLPVCAPAHRSGASPRGPSAAAPGPVGPGAAPAPPGGAHVASTTVPVPGGCDVPRTGPADAVGCYVAGTEDLGAAPATPLFWHLDVYPTRAAAEAARRGRGTVAEAHGRVWLFSIAEAGECAGVRSTGARPMPSSGAR